jgi:peptide/nickel transport system substrate-binding protein
MKTIWSAAVVLLGWCALAQAEDMPHRGGTLVYGVVGDPDTYDCHRTVSSISLQRILPHYSTLLKIDAAHYPDVVGDVAQSWQVSADGLTYTFKLHPNVLFHDGTPLTSADVKATYERLRNPQGGAISIRQSHFADIDAIETPDPQTVVFRLKQINGAMPLIFASPYNCLYSAARLAQDPKYPETNVMGTGPFKFVSYARGAEWRGERFDKYFVTGKPYLDGFVAHTVAGPALATALSGGQIMTEFRGLTPEQRDAVMAGREGKLRVVEVPWAGAFMLAFNAKRKPFDDARVRRALSLAIDRWTGSKALDRQMQLTQVGGFQRAGSPFGLSLDALAQKPGFSHDIAASRAEAKRLLAEAGVSNLTFTLLNRPTYTPVGVFLIDQWRQIGVTVEQQFPEAPVYFQRQGKADFDVMFDVMPDIVDDPYLQLSMFPSRSHNNANTAYYDDAKVDELYNAQVRTNDPAQRKKLFRELEDYMFQQSYYAMGYWGRRIIIMAKEVEGFVPTPAPGVGMQLADVWLKR